MSTIDQTIDSILEKSNGIRREDALKEFSLLIALSKRDKYKTECQKFKHKYQMNFEHFETNLHSLKNQEDYEKECELDDWEFAKTSLNWWEQKIKELVGVSN